MTEQIEYRVGDRVFGGRWFPPEGHAKARGVLVLHGGGGIATHEERVAARFAALGYGALVPDLFGERFTDRAHGMAVVGALAASPVELRARVKAALARLASRMPGAPLVASGHCFGGLAALELARSSADVRAVASLHGALHTREPAARGAITARVLACTGADDAFCTREHRAAFEAEMTNAGVDWQHHIYGGAQHGFTVDEGSARPGAGYHAPSDARSWRAMVQLFDEVTR